MRFYLEQPFQNEKRKKTIEAIKSLKIGDNYKSEKRKKEIKLNVSKLFTKYLTDKP
jgi:hypothetical protein